MQRFEEVKQELLSRVKNADEHAEELYKAIEDSKTKAELLKSVTTNFPCFFRTENDVTFLENNFTEKELKRVHIYTKGSHLVKTEAFVCDSAKVIACGSAIVYAYGSAKVTACGSAMVKVWGDVKVKAYDDTCVYAYDDSSVEDYRGNGRTQSNYR